MIRKKVTEKERMNEEYTRYTRGDEIIKGEIGETKKVDESGDDVRKSSASKPTRMCVGRTNNNNKT